MDNTLAYRVTELERRLANTMRIGVVSAADYPAGRVRVKAGDLITGWLPWLTQRAGGDRSWHAPEIGEQVIILSPNGEPAQGVVLPAIYQNTYPAPANTPDISITHYADGTVASHDRASRTTVTDMDTSSSKQTPDDITLTVGGASITATADAITLTVGGSTITMTGGALTIKSPRLELNP